MEYRTRAAVKITAAALAALAIGLIVKYVMLPAENPLDRGGQQEADLPGKRQQGACPL